MSEILCPNIYEVILRWFQNIEMHIVYRDVYRSLCIQHYPTSTAPLGKLLKDMKEVGYLLVKCRGHQPPLPSKQGFQRALRTLRRILHLSLPPERHQEKQTVQINHSRHTIMWGRKYWRMLQFREICHLSVNVRETFGNSFWCQVNFCQKVKATVQSCFFHQRTIYTRKVFLFLQFLILLNKLFML